MKMIQDSMEGKIDMILTKSISRFGRNTVDTLKYVRLLKEKGIAIYFEEERINTLEISNNYEEAFAESYKLLCNNNKKLIQTFLNEMEEISFVGNLHNFTLVKLAENKFTES